MKKDNRISIRLSAGHKLKFEQAQEREGLNQSDMIAFLLENYYGDDLNVLRRFRYNLKKRIQKGINILYINELKKVKDLIDPVLDKL